MRTLFGFAAVAVVIALSGRAAVAGENEVFYASIKALDEKKMTLTLDVPSPPKTRPDKSQTLKFDEKKVKLSFKKTGKAAKFSDFEKDQELMLYAEDGVVVQIWILEKKDK